MNENDPVPPRVPINQPALPRYRGEDPFAGAHAVAIQHHGHDYRLRPTHQNRLIPAK
jgi:hemin uptake protein HemP